jgi:thiamine-monophosphate kinase
MELNQIGEFEFIKNISRGCVIRPDNVIRAIGDDAAAFTVTPDQVSLITTDLLVEQIHFIRTKITGFDLGYKSMAVNLSDIAAMGGVAREAFVSIGIPPRCPLDYIEAFYDGMKHLAARFDVNILGGDTTGSKHDLIINVVVHGTVERNKLLRRDTARPGDIIVTTGYLGNSKAGLYLILNNLPVDSTEMQALYRAHVLPQPHLLEGHFLANQSGIRATIDLSDGLSADLGHITQQSAVGAAIYAAEIPVSDELNKFCATFGFDPLEYALSGGEDYTLLCTLAPEKSEKIRQEFKKEFERPLFHIGEATDNGRVEIIYPDGTAKPVSPAGWDHFRVEKG